MKYFTEKELRVENAPQQVKENMKLRSILQRGYN